MLRTVMAIVAGLVVAILLAYVGGMVWLLVTVGIPLGLQPRPPTPAEYASLLIVAGGGAAMGGQTGARLARARSRQVVLAVAVLLLTSAWWSFTRQGVGWPAWWGPALGIVMGLGAWVGGTLASRRSAAW